MPPGIVVFGVTVGITWEQLTSRDPPSIPSLPPQLHIKGPLMCGFLNIQRDSPSEVEYLARLTTVLGIRGRVQPMRTIPLVTSPTPSLVASWG